MRARLIPGRRINDIGREAETTVRKVDTRIAQPLWPIWSPHSSDGPITVLEHQLRCIDEARLALAVTARYASA